ncbi:MAG: delta-60 repeat domain-containing protein, partial [Variovorax sp.]
SVTVDATVTRSAGFDGAIELAVSGLPTGVSAAIAHIPAGATTATLTLSAEAAAPHSLPTAANVSGTSGALSAQQGVTVTVRGPAGALDTSFGSAGKAVTAVGPTDDYAQAMAVQPDGKIVVAGWGNGALGYAFEIVRYQRDGALDASFGSAGKVVTAVGNGAAVANAVALQADGKILVAGSVDETPKGKSFALVRYNADGSVDGSFGRAGKVITSFGSQSDEAFAIVVQPDGKIVLGGHTRSATRGIDFALARYNADGSADASFGVNGQVVTPIRGGDDRDSIYALALQTIDGEVKIVAAGGEGDFVLTRYHANGAVDFGF